MTGRRIIVTGATGFLGGVLTADLLARGNHVIALGRNTTKLEALRDIGAEAIPHNLASKANALPELSADACVHCAALSSPWARDAAFEAANITGTQNAVTLAQRAGARHFVHISTPSIYFDFKDQRAVKETAPLPKPINAYARTKYAAEQIVANAAELSTIILRPRGLYGAGDTALLPRLMKAANTRALPLMNDGRAATDLTHVDDVSAAIIAALDHGDSDGTYNISGGVALNVKDVVEAACARAGIKPRWRALPARLVFAYARAAEAVCRALPYRPEPAITAYSAGLFAYTQTLDISAAERDLGWTPQINFAEGLERTFRRTEA